MGLLVAYFRTRLNRFRTLRAQPVPLSVSSLALRSTVVIFKLRNLCDVARCVLCPSSTGASVGAMLGIGAGLAVAGFILFRIRNILPVGVIKLGVSMFQIVASGSTSYNVPW